MAKRGATKVMKPLTKRIVKLEKTQVCQFCGGKGYIELDKVGVLVTPCYNCGKGIAKARELGIPEDVIARYTNDNSDSGVGRTDSTPGGGDTGEPEKPQEPEAP